MKSKNSYVTVVLAVVVAALGLGTAQADEKKYVFKAGDPSLQEWLLPDQVTPPAGNEPSAARIKLGKTLFFDPRLSGDGSMSCATCHNPQFGWTDGLPTAVGNKSQILERATPTVVNTGYNTFQMWDGRKRTLEEQAMGPMEAAQEMNMDVKRLFEWLNRSKGYSAMFKEAYPGEAIDSKTLSKALAAYERTVVSKDSRFDRWVKGDAGAMTEQQVKGFELFVGKAKCVNCHSAPNFTDNGFHNLGLPSFGVAEPDLGRYGIKPLAIMKGAFKTPTLRDVSMSAPYFHDGSSATLADVVAHYNKGGVVKTNLSPNMHELGLNAQEQADVVAFVEALTSPQQEVTLPALPLD